MKDQTLHTSNYLLFFLFWFITSCNGQVKTNFPQGSGNEQNTITESRPKLVTTQGTNQYGSVSCGVQDKAGNLWFGTSGEGVYCYDGKSFTNYLVKDGLNSNNILSILTDKTGNIWFGTSAGLCRYDGTKFTDIPVSVASGMGLYPATEKAPDKGTMEVWSLILDKSGKLWIGTGEDGVYCYDGTSFTRLLDQEGLINKSNIQLRAVTSMMEDSHGMIWVTTWFEGLCCYDPAAGAINNFKPNGDRWFGSVYEDRSGMLWFGTRDHGAYCYDGKTFNNFFADTPIFNACGVCTMLEDNDGNIWFATESGSSADREKLGGVWCYKPRASQVGFSSMTNYTTKDGLRHNSVFSITKERSGKLWFGTRNMGLCSFDPLASSGPDGKAFVDYSDTGSKDFRSIFEDQAGNLWFGTNGDGVCRYDPSAAPVEGSQSFTFFTSKDGLSGTDVRCITADKNGELWFGTNGGVSKFDGKSFTNFTATEGLSNPDVWSLLIDRTGTIWAGTVEGVFRYDPSAVKEGSKAFVSFPIPAATENDFSRSVSGLKLIWDIKEDKAGNIWFATNGRGVYRFDPVSGGLTNFSTQEGLCNNYVNGILADKRGNLWFSTQHGGVSRYIPSKLPGGSNSPSVRQSELTAFTQKEGLCGNQIGSAFEDKAGNIWFAANSLIYPATHRGNACRYDGKRFELFADNEGLLSHNFIQNIFEDSKGNLWLASTGGLFHFDPAIDKFVNLTRTWAFRARLTPKI